MPGRASGNNMAKRTRRTNIEPPWPRELIARLDGPELARLQRLARLLKTRDQGTVK